MRYLVLIATVALVGCGANVEETAKDIAKHDLLDPEATQFRDLETHERDSGEPCVTGELNAKNRMGAYTGFRPFVVDMARKAVFIMPDDGGGSDGAIKAARVNVARIDCGIS